MKTQITQYLKSKGLDPATLTPAQVSAYGEAANMEALGYEQSAEKIAENVAKAEKRLEEIAVNRAIYAPLAEIAVNKYNLDPARVDRAVEMLAKHPNIIHHDINGLATVPSLTDATKSYSVTRGACTCADSAKGSICKHRIALWMWAQVNRTQPARTTIYTVKCYCESCMTEHFIEVQGAKEICHGANFDPYAMKNYYIKIAPAYAGAGSRKGLYLIPCYQPQYEIDGTNAAEAALIEMHDNA